MAVFVQDRKNVITDDTNTHITAAYHSCKVANLICGKRQSSFYCRVALLKSALQKSFNRCRYLFYSATENLKLSPKQLKVTVS